MHQLSRIILLSLLSLPSHQALGKAIEKCISGNPKNLTLIKWFEKAKKRDSILKLFLDGADPADSTALSLHKMIVDDGKGNQRSLSQINSTCIEAALKRRTSQKSYICQSPFQKKPTVLAQAGSAPCLNLQLLKFITWISNESVNCFTDLEIELDPLIVLKKWNNESGFSFFQAGKGGVGIGQLTSMAVREVNQNARDLIDKIKSTNSRSCAPFQQALNETPNSVIPFCAWLHPSEGLARSTIYSLIYFVHMRRLAEKRFSQQESSSMKRMILDQSALASYSRHGKEAQKVITANWQQSNQSIPDFYKRNRRSIAYINETEEKFSELLELTSPKATKAQDCLNP